MVAAALVAVVLLQRSEGGALGIGGGGSAMAGRGSANLLTRVTTFLAAAFFATSITLTILGQRGAEPTSILDRIGGGDSSPAAPATPGESTPGQGGGILDKLQPSAPASPQVPQSQ